MPETELPAAVHLPVEHRPGRHCASTALADLCRYHGRDWSEAFCFGLGSGLGTFYAFDDRLSPRRMIHVRSGEFERTFFERLGQPRAWESDDDAARSELLLERALASGRPALLRTDLQHLPYYGTKTSFPAHAILAVGYDRSRRVFSVFDTERPEAIEVPYEAMRLARYARNHPLGHLGDFVAPEAIDEPRDLAATLVDAIRHNASELGREDDAKLGLGALAALGADLRAFADDADWKWNARFAYQVIEKRGTGGGGFRLMYAEFLRTVEARVPSLADHGLSPAMEACAAAWTDLAMAMRAISERDVPDFAPAAPALRALEERERRYVALARAL